MPLVQAPRGRERLVEGPEHQGEHDREGAMEAPDRVLERLRVLRDGRGDPWMGELHQESASGTEEDERLPIDLPQHRVRAERPFEWPGGLSPDTGEALFEIHGLDDHQSDAHRLPPSCREGAPLLRRRPTIRLAWRIKGTPCAPCRPSMTAPAADPAEALRPT